MKQWLRTAWMRLRRRAGPLAAFVGAFWITHLIDVASGGELTRQFGLLPRRLDGLDGIVGMPFLHKDWEHLTLNTAPALILGGLISMQSTQRFVRATLIIMIAGGLLTWLFARQHNHIGASGLIFGWFGFVVAMAFLERSAMALIGAGIAIVFYGAPALLGLSPTADGVSWEGHLSGLITGVAAAFALYEKRAPRRNILSRDRA